MRRFWALLCALAALIVAQPAAAQFVGGAPLAVLGTPDPCPAASVCLDFLHNAYKASGVRARSFLALPGASFTNSTGGFGTFANGALQFFPPNTPRITDQGILIEGASTNLVTQSQTFSTWAPVGTAGGGGVTNNAGVAPDGTNAASIFTVGSNAFNGILRFGGVTYVAGSTYTVTVHVKPNGGTARFLGFRMSNWAEGTATDTYPFIDLQTMTTSSGGHSGITWTVAPLAAGWFRVGITVATNATIGTPTDIAATNSGGSTSGAAQAGQTLMLWGAQVEQAAFASSYIPTTSAAATRSADVISLPVTVPVEGIFAGRYVMPALPGAAPAREYLWNIIEVGNNRFAQRANDTAGNQPVFAVGDGTANTAIINSFEPAAGQLVTVAAAFSSLSSKAAMAVNAGAVQTTARGIAAAQTGAQALGIGQSAGGNQLNSYLQSLYLYQFYDQGAQLQSISAGNF